MNRDNIKYVKRDTFAPGFMFWAGVSSRGKTKLRIIDRGVKVDSRYYVRRVLTPFLDQDVPRYFLGPHQGTWSSTKTVLQATPPKYPEFSG